MLTLAEFNALVTRDNLKAGENFAELQRLGNLLAKVCGFVQVLAKSNTPVTRNSTNTTGTGEVDDDEEVEHGRVVIPAGTMRGKVSAHIHSMWRGHNSGSTKNYIVRVNGQSIGSVTTTTNLSTQTSLVIHSGATLNAQKAVNGMQSDFNAGGAAIQDLTFDNSSDIVITFLSKWNAAANGETITLESHSVTIYPG